MCHLIHQSWVSFPIRQPWERKSTSSRFLMQRIGLWPGMWQPSTFLYQTGMEVSGAEVECYQFLSFLSDRNWGGVHSVLFVFHLTCVRTASCMEDNSRDDRNPCNVGFLIKDNFSLTHVWRLFFFMDNHRKRRREKSKCWIPRGIHLSPWSPCPMHLYKEKGMQRLVSHPSLSYHRTVAKGQEMDVGVVDHSYGPQASGNS